MDHVQLTLGDVGISRVEEMHGPIMPTDVFFPDLPEQAWKEQQELLAPDHLSVDDAMVITAMQTWVLRSEGRTILIDTGVGNDKTRTSVEAWDHLSLDYLANLAAAGVRPEDVDLVINTHLHLDHIGWNTRLVEGEWVPTFANATYLMPRAELDFWDPATNPGAGGGINAHAYEDSIAPVLAAGQVQAWQDSHTIDAHLRLEVAPGHPPGASVITLNSGGERALFAGDILHTPLQVSHLDHNSCFDLDPVASRATRRRLLGWAADERVLLLPAHLSGHGALEVQRSGDGLAVKGWGPLPRY